MAMPARAATIKAKKGISICQALLSPHIFAFSQYYILSP
jgi:hypothetical protein